MIYTLTLNPSLDYIMVLENLKLGAVNRAKSDRLFAGGKGIKVSFLLKTLGIENLALGYIAGFTGYELIRLLNEEAISHSFIALEQGHTRINVKLQSLEDSEINSLGPVISSSELDRLYTQLEHLKDGDILVMGGSIPPSLPLDMYRRIMHALADKKIMTIIDSHKEALLPTLPYHPFLIKPNIRELAKIFPALNLDHERDLKTAAKELQNMGAKNILISLGDRDAILITPQTSYRVSAPVDKVHSASGSSDSMIGGFIAGYLQNQNLQEALIWAICSSSANLFSDGLINKESILAFIDAHQIDI